MDFSTRRTRGLNRNFFWLVYLSKVCENTLGTVLAGLLDIPFFIQIDTFVKMTRDVRYLKLKKLRYLDKLRLFEEVKASEAYQRTKNQRKKAKSDIIKSAALHTALMFFFNEYPNEEPCIFQWVCECD